jgi:hypothetical protein
LSGEENWEFEYTDVVEGENARSEDKDAKKEWQDKRSALRQNFEEKTLAWIRSEDEKPRLERERAVLEYRIVSIEADPYLRPRSVYHRQNNIMEDGTVTWHYQSPSADQNFGVPVSEMRQKLAEEGNSIKSEMNGAAKH